MRKKTFWDHIGHSRPVGHLLPEELTEAGFWFLLQAQRITYTFHGYQWMSKFLTSTEWQIEDYAQYLSIEGGPNQKLSENDVSFYEITMLQMVWADEIHFSKLCDLISAYMTDIIACAYRSDPNIIQNRSRFDLNFIRKYKTINDAVRSGAIAEIQRISRAGFSELVIEAKRVTQCALPREIEKELLRIMKLRNEIVHGLGSYTHIIDSMFSKKRKATKADNFVKHAPNDVTKAEVVACEVVGLLEAAAIKTGIDIFARRSEFMEADEASL